MSQTEAPKEHDAVRWFEEHFDAAQQIIDFVTSDGIPLEGSMAADLGSGDGIIDLGFVLKARPLKLVGFDIRPTDVDALRRSADAAGIEEPFPDADTLSFVESLPDQLPADDGSFDLLYSWSTFEHVDRPVRMLQEVRRVLKPGALFFLQLWPFFGSRHGGHAWMAIDEPFEHLRRSSSEMEQALRCREGTDPTRSADDEFRSLNRITLDALQRALLLARLRISKVELQAETVHIPPDVAHLPLTDLTISGIKLLATPV